MSVVGRSERRLIVVNVVLLALGYLLIGPYVVIFALFLGGVFVAPTILWLVGLILGVVLFRRYPWAAIRTARYIVIVLAFVAVASLVAPAFLSVPPMHIND